MIINEIWDADIIRVYTRYSTDARFSSNGGDYTFWTSYKNNKDGTWTRSFRTSADFDYCSVCGNFHTYQEGRCEDWEDLNGNIHFAHPTFDNLDMLKELGNAKFVGINDGVAEFELPSA